MRKLLIPIACLAGWGCATEPMETLTPAAARPVIADEVVAPADASATGKQLFDELWPALQVECASCHEEDPAPFLLPPDPYAAIVAWPGVVASDADYSRLLAYPRTGTGHPGTNLDAGELASTLLPLLHAWLEREAQERVVQHPTLGPFEVELGFNFLELEDLGDGPGGSVVTFDARELSSTLLKISSLEIHAGPEVGVHVVHPLFAVVDPLDHVEPDPLDSLSEVDQTFDAGDAGELAPGTVILTGWSTGYRLSLAFDVIEGL